MKNSIIDYTMQHIIDVLTKKNIMKLTQILCSLLIKNISLKN